jgi:Tol biopolymer transport system component
MKKLIIISLAVGLLMCKPTKDQNKKSVNPDTIELKKDIEVQSTKTTFNFDYLGETPPDTIPVIFAKDIVSTGQDESSFEIHKNGDLFIFAREGNIMMMIKQGDEWAGPTIAPFSGDEIDGECCFSPDGRKIYFASRRNLPGATGSLNTWVSDKTENCWSDPYPLKAPFFDQTTHAVSVAASGNIYYSGIEYFKLSEGTYSSSSPAGNNLHGSHPYIAPDESYIIFVSREPGRRDPDLYIAYSENGSWTEPKHFDENINTTHMESNPYVSPDGKYLFFIRRYDVYWVKFDKI